MNNANRQAGPKIIIAGAGSIGFFIGGLLQHTGQDVSYLARPHMVEAIGKTGLTLTDYNDFEAHIPANDLSLETDPVCMAEADIILVTVKSKATRGMAGLLSKHATKSTMIISMQNGIRNADILREALPENDVRGAMVPFNVAQMDGGRFHRGTSGNIIIEDGNTSVAVTLSSGILPIEETNDIRSVRWGKLLVNLNNALNALSGLPLAEQLSDHGWRKIMAAQMSEALNVMAVAGIKPKPPSPVPASFIPYILRLPTPLFRFTAKQMLSMDAHARSSMWEDLERGRITEIDELQGEIITLAKRLGKKAEINRKVYAKVKEAEALANGSPRILPKDIA